MPESTVVIVGAGASSLSAAGALHQRGIKPVLLEEDRAPGGTWTRRYDRLRLHTVRGFSGLAYYSIPRRYPQYLSRDQFAEYLVEYSRHFDLRIETGCSVRKIRPEPESASWTLATNCGDWSARSVVIATGQYRIPMLPAWPGREMYGGGLVHSVHYRNPAPYSGKRVLVVGAGNSGAEIATDIAEGGAATVALSIRTQPLIVPRDPFGFRSSAPEFCSASCHRRSPTGSRG
jgi:putative flavoprotein involved in K+ transport